MPLLHHVFFLSRFYVVFKYDTKSVAQDGFKSLNVYLRATVRSAHRPSCGGTESQGLGQSDLPVNIDLGQVQKCNGLCIYRVQYVRSQECQSC